MEARSIALVVSICCALTIGLASARQHESGSFHAGDADPNDYFGSPLSLSGDTVVVGAPVDDLPGLDQAGSVYVFARRGPGWMEKAKLNPGDPAAGDRFGESLSISGDTIVVGSRWDTHSGLTKAGSAYVFQRSGSSWTEQVKLVASDAAAYHLFGGAVSLLGDTLVVGAEWDPTHGTNAGAVYVFVRAGSTWVEQAKLFGNDTGPYDLFGANVTYLNEQEIVVAAVGTRESSYDAAGAVYVFQRSGSSWVQMARMTAPDPSRLAYLGHVLDASDDTIVASIAWDASTPLIHSGATYVFARAGGSWSLQEKLTASDAGEYDYFGSALSLSGDRLVAGARGDDHSGCTRGGSAYWFTRTGSTWSEDGKLIASDAESSDALGSAVCLDGDTVLAGVTGDDLPGLPDAGSVYHFDLGSPGTPYCFGNGCPCGNDDPGAGCRNSGGGGALLRAGGTSGVATDDLSLLGADLPPSQSALLFVGLNQTAGGAGSPLGDGLRCADGQVRRLGVKNTGTAGQASWGPGLAGSVGFTAGDLRHFQLYYRDVAHGPCSSGFNLSNGVTVLFTP